MARKRKMDETELLAIVAHEISSAAAVVGSELSREREQALDYYHGRPFGNEIQGRSAVVSRDVADTIEWILPSLLEIFAAGDEVGKFEPRQAEDEAAAAQATDYVGWIVNQENEGFLLTYTWLKDALLQKTGILKVLWEESRTVTEEAYDGLTGDEMTLLLADKELELVAHSERQAGEAPERGEDERDDAAGEEAEPMMPASMMPGPMMPGPMMPAPAMGPAPTVHDVRVKRRKSYGCPKIYPVPPEEFLIARRARDLASAPFVAHRVKKTVSELIEQGYKREVVESLPDYSASVAAIEAVARNVTQDPVDRGSLDPSMREVAITECYLQVDWDGDGIAEMRCVTVGGVGDGGVLLANKPCDVAPFTALCPILMPHEFYGLSVADLVMDLQLIKSTIMRQMLDGLYLANNPRHAVLDNDRVNLDDMLTSRPGGVVRVKELNAIMPLNTQWVGAQAFPMLEYVDGMREGRTGISKAFQGLDANALNNQTATAYAQMTSAAQSRVKLIARIFAETGFKRLYKLVLGLVAKHQQQARIIRLRGEFVPMDPRTWTTEMDMSITVGLGTGNKMEQLQHLGLIASKQEQIIMAAGPDNPLCGLPELYTTYAKLIELAGLKSPASYFKDPGKAAPSAPQPPKPDPKMLETQAKIAADQAKAQSDLEIAKAKLAAEMELAQARLAGELQLERMKAEAEIALKRDIAIVDAQARVAQMAAAERWNAAVAPAGIAP